MQAESGRVQAGRGVTQMGFFNPQQGGAILALLTLVVVAALEAHQQHSDEEDTEDREGIKEDKVEQGLVGAHH